MNVEKFTNPVSQESGGIYIGDRDLRVISVKGVDKVIGVSK